MGLFHDNTRDIGEETLLGWYHFEMLLFPFLLPPTFTARRDKYTQFALQAVDGLSFSAIAMDVLQLSSWWISGAGKVAFYFLPHSEAADLMLD